MRIQTKDLRDLKMAYAISTALDDMETAYGIPCTHPVIRQYSDTTADVYHETEEDFVRSAIDLDEGEITRYRYVLVNGGDWYEDYTYRI